MRKIKAVIFDFDGVIADTEELHFNCLKSVLSKEGICIDRQIYDQLYLALDDKNCFKEIFLRERLRKLTSKELQNLVRQKAELFRDQLENVKLFQGIREWVQKYSSEVSISICSGALREEILSVLRLHSLLDYFSVVIASEDVQNSKPSPEGYLLALEKLKDAFNGHLSASECLVIEDSIAGIKAAKLAQMRCVAIANSYPKEKLSHADLVFDSISQLNLSMINDYFFSDE
jgi:HAD superfamily hydrolase (TIGR01509 family)